MKKLLLVLVLLLTACSKPVEKPAPVVSPPPERPDYSEYTAAFESVVPGATVSARKSSRITVVIATDLSSSEQPEDWSEICDRLTAAHSGFDDIAAQIEAEDGVILANSINGRIAFDAFNRTEFSPDNPPTISLEEFNKIKTGMTYKEVIDIIGSPGEQMSHTDMGLGAEYVGDTYTWEGETFGANAVILFEGGKVVSKSQLLLS